MSLVREHQQVVILRRANQIEWINVGYFWLAYSRPAHLVFLNQCIDEPSRMPEVHVFINKPVNEQKFSFHFVHMLEYAANFITVLVRLWRSHVSLRVVCIIPIPRGHWCACNAHLEDWRLAQRHTRHVPPVAPTVHAAPSEARRIFNEARANQASQTN